MAWSAGWNLTGYLCETDPLVFANFEDARGYISDEIERWWHTDAETEYVDDRYLPAHVDLHNAATESDFSTTIDLGRATYHFWIVEVDDSQLEREDEYV